MKNKEEVNDFGSNKSKTASKNIWYALATITGVPEHILDVKTIDGNAHHWNGYLSRLMGSNKRNALQSKNGNKLILPTLSLDEVDFIRQTLEKSGFDIKDLKGQIDFSKVKFEEFVSFEKFIFTGITNFSGATFTQAIDFQNVFFTDLTHFQYVTFIKQASFNNAIFTENAIFNNAIFTHDAHFHNTTFTQYANFEGATFGDKTYFTNSTFVSTSNFKECEFLKYPPEFYDAQLSQSNDWHKTAWPKPPSKDNANYHVIAYEYLSFIMSKLAKHHDQHMFFRLEMRARRRLEKKWSTPRVMNWIYEKICDYGYGFERALKLWGLNWVLGAFLTFPYSSLKSFDAWPLIGNALATSFANCHSFLGLNRSALNTVYKDYETGVYASPIPFNVVWMFQALFGIVFLFFLLLTIRNRFRMR